MMRLYCVYDLEQKKADALFTFDNDVVAKRYFKATMSQPGMKDCCKEFQLQYVGEFNEETLSFHSDFDPKLVYSGVDCYLEGDR